MKHVFIAWFWVLLGVYFAFEIVPFVALACGYMAGLSVAKEQSRGR